MYYREITGWKYELAEEEVFETGIRIPADIDIPFIKMRKDGFLTVERGYAWDGPSGPAIDTPDFMRASLAHDALYQLMRMGLLSKDRRDEADALLRRLCREDGMSAVRATWVYCAVRAMGWLAVQPNPKDTAGLKVAP